VFSGQSRIVQFANYSRLERNKSCPITVAYHHQTYKSITNHTTPTEFVRNSPFFALMVSTPISIYFLSNHRNKIKNSLLKMDKTKSETQEQKDSALTPKVTGIGGIFFFTDNPNNTKDWYQKNLGIDCNEWGATFASRNLVKPEEINYLQWSPFTTGSEYFAPSKKEFMINYRVQNIEGLVAQLKANGVTILDEIASFDYGKFVHIMDHEGNKLELWEPVEDLSTPI
jgi:predicted enzyme related to lactoylglutathione lyase